MASTSPRRVLVLSVDEKSQMQALDQPLLAFRTSGAENPRMQRHDLAVRSPRRRYRQSNRQVLPPPPPQRGIPQVRQLRQRSLRSRHRHGQLRDPQDGSRWFAKRSRWHVHYTPVSTSAKRSVLLIASCCTAVRRASWRRLRVARRDEDALA